tara:strand:+ start:4122 stop:4292 length:171 start_codon:yes stop_codon:yes gene_type:complete
MENGADRTTDPVIVSKTLLNSDKSVPAWGAKSRSIDIEIGNPLDGKGKFAINLSNF